MKHCKIRGCGRLARSGGMCNAHYARHRRHGNAKGVQTMRDDKPALCSAPGCLNPNKCAGLCGMHYERRRKTGTLKAKAKRPAGEGTIKEGYVVFVKHIGGRKVRTRRCRIVMELKIGRKLRSDETVHHKNGDRQDDRPKNLELWTSRHPKGQRVSDLVKFAKEILSLYS